MASSPRTGRSSTAITALIIGAILVIGVAAVVLLSGGDPVGMSQRVVDSLYPPEAVTTQGAEIRELYAIVFLIAVVVFFLVEGLIVWTVLRYRRKPGDDTLPPQTHGNNVAEIVWTLAPLVVVLYLFFVSWQTLNSIEAVSANPETRIRAVAGQFQWTFDYLDETGENVLYTEFLPTGEDGGMNVPAGRSVYLTLESPDVIHAFYVPQFLFKRDVVPGRVNSFEFDVDERFAGQTFRGQCAELCGAGHRVMLFDVHAKTPADFDAWLAAKVEAANASPTPAPSAEPGASGEPGASAPPAEGPTVNVSALNIAFEQADLQVPADTPFKLTFENKDANTPHNVEIKDASGGVAFQGEIFNGVDTRTYDVPALPAGTYTFLCTVHPNMTGTLTAN